MNRQLPKGFAGVIDVTSYERKAANGNSTQSRVRVLIGVSGYLSVCV